MNGMTKLEQTMAILDVKKDDPVGTYGAQGVLNKLAGRSIHIPRSVPHYFWTRKPLTQLEN